MKELRYQDNHNMSHLSEERFGWATINKACIAVYTPIPSSWDFSQGFLGHIEDTHLKIKKKPGCSLQIVGSLSRDHRQGRVFELCGLMLVMCGPDRESQTQGLKPSSERHVIKVCWWS